MEKEAENPYHAPTSPLVPPQPVQVGEPTDFFMKPYLFALLVFLGTPLLLTLLYVLASLIFVGGWAFITGP